MVLVIIAVLGGTTLVIQQQRMAQQTQRELVRTLNELRASGQAQTPTATDVGVNALSVPQATPSTTTTSDVENLMTSTTAYGITLSYPKGWSLKVKANEFMPSSPSVLLTSQPGELRIGGGPGETGVTYFDTGYQMRIQRLMDPNELSELRTQVTQNSMVKSVVNNLCDGAGCPEGEYIFTKNNVKYHIITNYRFEAYQLGMEFETKIINSLR